MYYEEKLINGVLHYRTVPDGIFIPKTPEQLTAMILELRKEATNASLVDHTKTW